MTDQPTHARRIAHLDMDAFFASVQLLHFPQLRYQPVVIGGGRRHLEAFKAELMASHPEHDWDAPDALGRVPLEWFPRLANYAGRGVATTATYAARKFGVGSAMGLMKAAKLCPQAILLPVDWDEVKRCSQTFKRTIVDIAPVMEDRGIDEVYIDFTDVPGGQRENGRVLARLIQKQIHEALGLTCSIGVAPNKLLAKMASEFKKPNGISIVMPDDLQSLIWPLPCRKVNGIGPKADEKLKRYGISTIGDLAAQEKPWLIETFGKSYGAWLHEVAWGRDNRAVVTESEPVSMSRETTFERDLHARADREELGRIFTRLCEQVAADLQRKGYKGRTIGIKLRYDNFQAVTRDLTIDQFTDGAATIRAHAGQCLKRVDLSRKIRLLGVRVGKLVKCEAADNGGAVYSAGHSNASAPNRTVKEGPVDEYTELLFPDLD